MKFELGEIVYALHFDKEQYVYLEESMIVTLKVHPVSDIYVDDVKTLIPKLSVRIIMISYDDEQNKYFISKDKGEYSHPEELIFKTKQEALLYLHGIVSEVAK